MGDSDCRGEPGAVIPVIDRRRCEGKAACVAVCPYGVFTLQPLAAEAKAALPWWARLRLALHGGKQAVAVNADACRACGKCVAACPEDAISLTPRAR